MKLLSNNAHICQSSLTFNVNKFLNLIVTWCCACLWTWPAESMCRRYAEHCFNSEMARLFCTVKVMQPVKAEDIYLLQMTEFVKDIYSSFNAH